MALSLTLFGAFQLKDNQLRIQFPLTTARALLSYLALDRTGRMGARCSRHWCGRISRTAQPSPICARRWRACAKCWPGTWILTTC